ncbi:PREDICTED: serine/threonine-protein kinase 3-like [Erythranthe guttata]|uniref:serine/threonine-protein kinase 3-like n=1 Tax=Erythranthe guttata TaxID=4155 RepID=UPI00064DB8DD|nr:PREDICTED: serine/threonine-protein kinase 3-like [Erythranthe guttata]|eukprot:XP_012832346.1 PREDICTED: serine/threonine-protein kinase 3-like [Erythranthe guttata]
MEGIEINPQLLYPIGGTKPRISEDSVTQTAVVKFLNEGFDLQEANTIVQKLKSAVSDTDSFVIPRDFLRFGDELAMVMPYVDGGSVKSLMSWGFKRGLPEDYVGFLLKNVLHALVLLHSMSLFHGNLKCGNILISSDGHVKLSGIGFPKYVMEGRVNLGEQYF